MQHRVPWCGKRPPQGCAGLCCRRPIRSPGHRRRAPLRFPTCLPRRSAVQRTRCSLTATHTSRAGLRQIDDAESTVGQGYSALIPNILSVGTAITHRLTHPADGSPFGAPSVKGNLLQRRTLSQSSLLLAISSLTRGAQRFHQPGSSRSEPARRCPFQLVAETWRWPAEGGQWWASEGGDCRFRPSVERRRLFILDPLHERLRRSVSPWMLFDLPHRRQVEVDSSGVICWSVSS